MTKLCNGLLIAAAVALMTAPALAKGNGNGPWWCQLLPDFPGCHNDNGECDCQEEIANLQAQIDAEASARATVEANLQDQIDALQGDVNDLEQQVGDLMNSVDCDLLAEIAEGVQDCDGNCVNTLTDEANCGECGNACGEFETCTDGVCETTACPPPSTDLSFECNTATRNADGQCVYVAVTAAIGGACDDQNACTVGTTCQAVAEGATASVCGGGTSPCDAGETCSPNNATEDLTDFICTTLP